MKAMMAFWLAFGALVGIGWVLNVVDLVAMGTENVLTIEGGLRIVGVVFVPLGAVMGYFV